MLRKLRERINSDERGFTLIELLVVILIIGILAAIALPAFLGQQAKAEDADAKSNARNVVSEGESCYATTRDYTQCPDVVANAGLEADAVAWDPIDEKSYEVTATSESGNTFSIARVNGGVAVRSCTNAEPDGGCSEDETW